MDARAPLAALLASLAATACAGKTSGAIAAGGGEDLTPPAVLEPRGLVDPVLSMSTLTTVRVGYLHHSTGGVVWGGGVPQVFAAWNQRYGTQYVISERSYPADGAGYGWRNYPFDYWNLWVSHPDTRVNDELTLPELVAQHDVIVWKHCFPVSDIGADSGTPDVASDAQTLENYRAQYAALKTRLRQYPQKRFVVWTPPALLAAHTSAADAGRAQAFSTWVKQTWDEPGDNIFVWDFRALEADAAGLYLPPGHAAAPDDDHPSDALGAFAAPHVARRIIDVIEGRGDTGSLTGRP